MMWRAYLPAIARIAANIVVVFAIAAITHDLLGHSACDLTAPLAIAIASNIFGLLQKKIVIAPKGLELPR